jgi:hypothetical protein
MITIPLNELKNKKEECLEMNIIEINKESLDSFRYDEIKGFVTYLEQNPEENKGTLVIRLKDIERSKEEPIFLNKSVRAWYMGLMYNTPNLLYFLSDKPESTSQWSDLQFAIMMFGTIKVKSTDSECMTYEVKMNEEIFQSLVQNTAEYMVKVSKTERLSKEEEDFFTHIIFDYTNGFDSM